jgi:hypothetical protein
VVVIGVVDYDLVVLVVVIGVVIVVVGKIGIVTDVLGIVGIVIGDAAGNSLFVDVEVEINLGVEFVIVPLFVELLDE